MIPTNAYVFVPKGRSSFLQQWLWKALTKLGAVKMYYEETIEYNRIDIDKGILSEKLLAAYYDCFPTNRPSRVYMGPRELVELLDIRYDGLQLITFDIEMGCKYTLYNLPVTIVPHMNGVLII